MKISCSLYCKNGHFKAGGNVKPDGRCLFCSKNYDSVYMKKYYEENKDTIKQNSSEWARNNKEAHRISCNKASRAWKAKNRKTVYYTNSKRAALIKDAGTFTQEEWYGLIELYDFACLACGDKSKPLTVDHIIPISKNGSNTIDNIQPLCLSCNCSKNDKIIDYRKVKI